MTGRPGEKVCYEVSAGIGTITMNAPENRNAFDDKMLGSLSAAFEQARLDPEVAVVVFTGASRRSRRRRHLDDGSRHRPGGT